MNDFIFITVGTTTNSHGRNDLSHVKSVCIDLAKNLSNLNQNGGVKKDLENFYKKLIKSRIFWINQHRPAGFGDAVLAAESFVGNEDFLVSAGDTLLPKSNKILRKLATTKLKGKNDVLILLHEVVNPKRFGVAVVQKKGRKIFVKNVEEKPKRPKSNLAIVAVYHFKPSIFNALMNVQTKKKDLQLTDGIQELINRGGKVKALILRKNDTVIDIGTPNSYLDALKF